MAIVRQCLCDVAGTLVRRRRAMRWPMNVSAQAIAVAVAMCVRRRVKRNSSECVGDAAPLANACETASDHDTAAAQREMGERVAAPVAAKVRARTAQPISMFR